MFYTVTGLRPFEITDCSEISKNLPANKADNENCKYKGRNFSCEVFSFKFSKSANIDITYFLGSYFQMQSSNTI